MQSYWPQPTHVPTPASPAPPAAAAWPQSHYYPPQQSVAPMAMSTAPMSTSPMSAAHSVGGYGSGYAPSYGPVRSAPQTQSPWAPSSGSWAPHGQSVAQPVPQAQRWDATRPTHSQPSWNAMQAPAYQAFQGPTKHAGAVQDEWNSYYPASYGGQSSYDPSAYAPSSSSASSRSGGALPPKAVAWAKRCKAYSQKYGVSLKEAMMALKGTNGSKKHKTQHKAHHHKHRHGGDDFDFDD